MRKYIYILSLCAIMVSLCVGGCGLVYKQHIFGDYYLTAPDAIEQCALSYHNKETGGNNYGIIIDETVFAVGFNDDYLIAKQCDIIHVENEGIQILPWNMETRVPTNIRYYILPILPAEEGMNWQTKNGLLGPLTLEEFEGKRAELGISDIPFSFEVDI